jgi:hypothetical protein
VPPGFRVLRRSCYGDDRRRHACRCVDFRAAAGARPYTTAEGASARRSALRPRRRGVVGTPDLATERLQIEQDRRAPIEEVLSHRGVELLPRREAVQPVRVLRERGRGRWRRFLVFFTFDARQRPSASSFRSVAFSTACKSFGPKSPSRDSSFSATRSASSRQSIETKVGAVGRPSQPPGGAVLVLAAPSRAYHLRTWDDGTTSASRSEDTYGSRAYPALFLRRRSSSGRDDAEAGGHGAGS